jgi:ketosteroid isomerase-like protein
VSHNVDVVRAWIATINAGHSEPEPVIALVTPDFELVESSTLPGAARAQGIDELRRYFYGWLRNWTDWRLEEEEIVDVPPDKVILIATLHLRAAHTGIDLARRWVYLYTVRDGKLAKQVGFDDRETALRAAKA